MRNITIPTAAAACLLGLFGCVATKYEAAKQGAPQPTLLYLEAATPPLEVGLRSVIVDGGPGSWKMAALWDEYVVTIRNQSEKPLTISEMACSADRPRCLQ